MTETHRPIDAAEVEALIAWAAAERRPLRVRGGGTKQALLADNQALGVMDLGGLSGVVDYDPAELILVCKPCTPLAEIDAQLAVHGQYLAFEPPYLALGTGQPTVGGTVSANLAGPRRVAAGGARDHLLGIKAVSGRGGAFQAGGRVVKNVTGYDLCKLMAGSWGTLAVMTELVLKTLPAPESAVSIVFNGLDEARANAAMTRALQSALEVSAAAHLPAGLETAAPARTILRLEGPAASLPSRADDLAAQLSDCGAAQRLDGGESAALWAAIREAAFFAPADDRALWRLSVAPAGGAAIMQALAPQLDGPQWYYDWGGGLIWLAVAATGDAGASRIRSNPAIGAATLIRAPGPVRAAVPSLAPAPAGVAALNARIKAQFDPHNILNPGVFDHADAV